MNALASRAGLFMSEHARNTFRYARGQHDPPTIRKENLHIIVVGGPGKHSSYLPGHVSHMVTKAIQ